MLHCNSPFAFQDVTLPINILFLEFENQQYVKEIAKEKDRVEGRGLKNLKHIAFMVKYL